MKTGATGSSARVVLGATRGLDHASRASPLFSMMNTTTSSSELPELTTGEVGWEGDLHCSCKTSKAHFDCFARLK